MLGVLRKPREWRVWSAGGTADTKEWGVWNAGSTADTKVVEGVDC